MKRETVGKISTDLLAKEMPTHDPIELEREMNKNYEENVLECLARGKKEYEGDFYIIVLTKKERTMQNVLRKYYFGRRSCPTPEYDQVVYHYNKADDNIEFLWVLPSKDTCELLRDNAALVDPLEWGILDFVLKLYSGDLLNVSKKRNGERIDSPLLA